ncbi:MAG: FkbM family methyltransferase [Flavobacteriales bacterium]|nr:FkbM family methyltransferase [Flavobacteriales bacterium]
MTRQGNLIYDVGMHKGEDTAYYLKKGFNVISFEADPDLANACRDKFASEIDQGKLTIVEGAIVTIKEGDDANEKIKFYKNSKQSVWGTVVDDWAERNEQFGSGSTIIEVQKINFADCVRKYGVPHYLKIDIEGMDTVCLHALLEFDEKPAYISIESEKLNFDQLVKEFDLFSELGYSNFQNVNQALISKQQEPNPSEEGHYIGETFISGSTGLFGKDLSDAWISREQSIEGYKKIFDGYKNFGDKSPFRNTYIGKKIVRYMNKHWGFPGWFDTHAKHNSIK